jgi:hypothetical protein
MSEKIELYIIKNRYHTEVKKSLFASTGCTHIIQNLMTWCNKNGLAYSHYPNNLWIEFETEEDLAQFTLSWL